jgi:hypothetical protein
VKLCRREVRPHSAHGERDGADKSMPVEQIELERNLTLQRLGIHLEVNHQYTIPARGKQGFAKPRQHTLACGPAWLPGMATIRCS